LSGLMKSIRVVIPWPHPKETFLFFPDNFFFCEGYFYLFLIL
jgi:hypothetical protein